MKYANMNAVERLDLLLEQERGALLTADFPSLPSILEEKTHLMDQLANSGAADEALQGLSRKVSRNQLLLNEAMAGIRSASKLLADLKITKRSINTYDYMGRRRTLTPDATVSVEKKA